jgi:hypothetical protein
MTATPKTALFIDESTSLRLAYCCDECRHFRSDAAVGKRCAVMYPTAPHERANVDAVDVDGVIQFCKMFESE